MNKHILACLWALAGLVCSALSANVFAQIRTIENNRACNDPVVGPNTRVTNLSGSLLSLGLLTNAPNLINGNLDDFATATLNAGLGANTTIASIQDTTQYYPGGNRVGFVISESSGLLGLVSANLLNSLRIETYRNGTLQQAATIGGALPIQIGSLSGVTPRQIISFTTTSDFDEVRLVTSGSITATISALRIYYAFEEPPTCALECTDALAGSGFTTTSASSGVCLNPLPVSPVADANNASDADTTNFATISTFLGITCSGSIRVASATAYPAGYEAGFVIANSSGALSAGVLNNITVSTYLGTLARESFTGNNLIAYNLLNDSGPKKIGFKSTKSFDRIEITVSGLVNAATTTRIYYAYVVADNDGDGIPNCRDSCPQASAVDTDGDGIFDACDRDVASIAVFKASNASQPAILDSQVTFSITARKDSLTATGLVIQDSFTSGLTYISHVAPTGTHFNSTTGIWTVGSALSDPTVTELTLTIVASIDTVGISLNTATITAINEYNYSADSASTACVSVPYVICSGERIKLTAPQGLATYQWFNGSNAISGATDSTYLATETGVYLYNANSAGGCTTGNCCPIYVTVNAAPVAAIAGNTQICGTGSLTLTASGGATYLWSSTETTAEITVAPTFSTTYTLIATNAAGCTDTASIDIRVSPRITSNLLAICNNNNTPANSTDDVFTFTLNPAGGSGTQYSISGAVTVANQAYGVPYRSSSFPISGGGFTINLTDNETGCTQAVQVTPPTNCSTCPPVQCAPIGVQLVAR